MPNMSLVVELMERLLEVHRQMGRPVADAFAPGLTDAEIDAQAGTFPFALPKPVRELYRWRNGVPWQKGLDRRIFWHMEMWPLAETIDSYDMRRETHGDEYFPADWYPLFNSNFCDAMVVRCQSEPLNEVEVIPFFNECPNNKPAYRSLEQLLTTILEMFAEGSVFSIKWGQLSTDFLLLRRIGTKLNPDMAPFWNDPWLPYGGLEDQ